MTQSEKPRAYHAYQQLADAYSAKVETKPHNAYYDRPAMLGLLPEVKEKKVLDAGCGPGVYTQLLLKRGASVIGIDMSDRMLELAGERNRNAIKQGRAEFRLVDMTSPLTMFEDGEFDVVNAPLCLDYVKNWLGLFREFYRVLKPGGTFLFSCGHPAFDADYFGTNDYFTVEPVQCTWRGFGMEIEMPSYRRSLEEIIMPVIKAGFVLERLHEPLPTDKFKKADPRRFMQLMHRPGFLCVRAKKAETSGP